MATRSAKRTRRFDTGADCRQYTYTDFFRTDLALLLPSGRVRGTAGSSAVPRTADLN